VTDNPSLHSLLEVRIIEARRIAMLISLLCIALFQVTPSMADTKNRTPSILSRLQVVQDPELGQLIRVAIENFGKEVGRGGRTVRTEEELSISRKVTESYAQIKLLDRQIELLGQRVRSVAGPNELQYELILARAELETKRMTELVNLRKIVGIMPDYPLRAKPTERLKAWLKLDVLDSHVFVSEGVRPFGLKASCTSYIPVGLMPKAEAMKVVSKHLSVKNRLPIRIDIYRNANGVTLSKELEKNVIALIRKAKAEMQAEVHLDDSARTKHAELSLYLERGRIATYRGDDRRRVPRVYIQGFIEPNELGQHAQRQLMTPGYLWASWDVIYDPTSRELSIQVAQDIRKTVESLGLADYVKITRTMQELDPERQYLGQWEATRDGKVIAMTIMEESKCRLLTKNQDTVAGYWGIKDDKLHATIEKEIILGHIDSAGNLAIESKGNTGTSISFKRAD